MKIKKVFDEDVKILKGISFGLLSPDMIRKMSRVEVKIPDTYDEDGYPIENGLMDPRMGVIDPGLTCKTCGAKAGDCPGHFGHIELTRPVLHIGYIRDIYLLLKVTCKKCGRLLLSKDDIEKYKKILEDSNDDIGSDVQADLIDKLKKIKICPHCGEEQQEIKLVKPYFFYEMYDRQRKRLYPTEIRERLEKIPDDDLKLLGFNPYVARPEWAVLTCLPVPPVTARPSIILESGERSEDDLTHKLVDILRVNQRFADNIAGGAPMPIIEDLWDVLQYHVATFFTNEISGVPAAKHRSGRALKTLYQRIKGKEGRIRYNLSGKRVNYSARTVITPEPRAAIDELYVPEVIAKELTYPEKVTEWNIEYLKEIIKQGKANYVLTETGHKIRVLETNKEKLCELLKPGWAVLRQLRNGDIVLFNRQPSLHRVSMMSLKVKIKPGKTFSFNDCIATPYNADFDGDEMNMHVPQSEEARAEAKLLLDPKKHIIGVGYPDPMISLVLDHKGGVCLLTMDKKIDKTIANYLLAMARLYDVSLEDKEYYEGNEIFSLILPKDFNFETETGTKEKFVVKNGKIIEGYVDGKVSKKLVKEIYKKYGPEIAADFINRASWLGAAYVTLHGLTIGFKDVLLDKELKEYVLNKLSEAEKKAEEYIKQYYEGNLDRLPGKTMRETVQALVLNAIMEAWNEIGEYLLNNISMKENNLVLMIRTGMKGKTINLNQMAAAAGLFTVRGQPVSRGYRSNRVLPHFKPGEISLKSLGFSKSSLADGLDLIENFFYCMSAVDSIVDKGVNTANSGYLYRRLLNALFDLVVEEDLSVRDSAGNVVQFLYGEDGKDPQNIMEN